MNLRIKLDNTIDFLRMKFDSFPTLDYQPLPWIGLHKARRDAGVLSRWNLIEKELDRLNVHSNMDIGCNVGYFSISIAKKGITALGVEGDPKYYRMLQYTIRKMNLKNIGVLSWQLNEESIKMLPAVDSIIFLSVWHHLVKHQGHDSATNILKTLWEKNKKVLFFETGELEMPEHYNLPDMQPSPKAYLSKYLEDTCHGSKVKYLGQHQAFSPDNNIINRNLFAVIRTTNEEA